MDEQWVGLQRHKLKADPSLIDWALQKCVDFLRPVKFDLMPAQQTGAANNGWRVRPLIFINWKCISRFARHFSDWQEVDLDGG